MQLNSEFFPRRFSNHPATFNITSSEDYVILDLRSNDEKRSFNFLDHRDQIGLKAGYAQLDYDSVRYSPHDLFQAVNRAAGGGKETLEVPCESPVNLNRDQPLLIMCGDDFCGCRYMYATWYGFRNVTTVEKVNKFLPPSVFSPYNQVIRKWRARASPSASVKKSGKVYGPRISTSELKKFLAKYNLARGIKK